MVRVGRIDPKRVVVSMDSGDDVGCKRLAPVFRNEHRRSTHPYALVVVGIDANLAVVHRTVVSAAHHLPGHASIFGPEDATFGILKQRVDDVRIAAVDVDSYTAGYAIGQTVCESGPIRSAVDRFVEPAMGPASVKAPGGAAALIGRGIQCERTLRINGDVDDSGVFVDEQG